MSNHYTAKKAFVLILLGNLLLAAPVAKAEEGEGVTAHVRRAIEAAGDEFKFMTDGFLCKPAEQAVAWSIRNTPGFLDPDAPAVKPFKAFDNLYYFGLYAIGSWLLDTGDGLILFDALNNEHDVKNILLPGMEEFGLDPNDLKLLVITHGHFDHYGGAHFLQKEFDVPVMMSALDWDALDQDIALPYAIRAGYPSVTQPERDIEVEDGHELSMGNASIKFVVTPGHTVGTLSPILKVQDKGQDRYVAMWGGQALHPDLKILAQMHNSLHRFWRIAMSMNAEAVISTHPWVVGNFQMLEANSSSDRSPLLIGADGVDRVFEVYDECMAAQFARANVPGGGSLAVGEPGEQ